MPQNQPEQEESQPIGQLNYFNVLATSIQSINNAIINEKDPRDAAENLLTDLPDEWTAEIEDSIYKVSYEYNKAVDEQNLILKLHVKDSIKMQARKDIYLAGKKYSRDVKKIIVTLLKKKNLLFPTKKLIERGEYFSLMKDAGEIDDE